MPTPNLVEQAASVLKVVSHSEAEAHHRWQVAAGSHDFLKRLDARTAGSDKDGVQVLFEHGNIETTVRKMDEKDASRHLKQFTKEVTQLATDIEQARSEQPRRRKS